LPDLQLNLAILLSNIDIVKVFLNCAHENDINLDINEKDKSNVSSLLLAIYWDNIEIVWLLIGYAK